MKYRVGAFRAKMNSMLELEDGQLVAGVVFPAGTDELFIVYLDPLEQLELPEMPDEAEKDKVESKESKTDEKVGKSDGD